MKISEIKKRIGYTKIANKCENCVYAKIIFDICSISGQEYRKSIFCTKFEKEFKTIYSATCKEHERGEPKRENLKNG